MSNEKGDPVITKKGNWMPANITARESAKARRVVYKAKKTKTKTQN